jgi:hypothetical protein
MKRIKQFALVGLSALVLSACSTVFPVTATNNPIGSKEGTSKTSILFGGASGTNLGGGLVFNKNYGVIEAAENGNVEKVATVDIKVTNFLIFRKAEIIVTGE